MDVELHGKALSDKMLLANDRANSMRSSAVISASAGSATTISRATCASRRFSAISAVFHSTPESRNCVAAPSGNSTS